MNQAHAESAYLSGRVQWLRFWEQFSVEWFRPTYMLALQDIRETLLSNPVQDDRVPYLIDVIDQITGGYHASRSTTGTEVSLPGTLSRHQNWLYGAGRDWGPPVTQGEADL